MKSYKDKYNERMRECKNATPLEGEKLVAFQNMLARAYFEIEEKCNLMGITCFLVGGSCLGAVRHNGFIPWDDDLDIGMPRKDYERFKNIFDDEFGDKYILNSPRYSDDPITRFPKILIKGTKAVPYGAIDNERACAFLDIFILDEFPQRPFLRFFKGVYTNAIMYISARVLDYRNWRERRGLYEETIGKPTIIGIVFSPFGTKRWFDVVDKTIKNSKDMPGDLVGFPTGRKHYFGHIFDKSILLPTSKGMFCGKNVNLPNKPEEYLKKEYGDYLMIPPEDKREKHYYSTVCINID